MLQPEDSLQHGRAGSLANERGATEPREQGDADGGVLSNRGHGRVTFCVRVAARQELLLVGCR
jgi:hypothetical protein